MLQNSKDITVLFPQVIDEEKIKLTSTMKPFDDKIIDFLQDLANELTNHSLVRRFPDVATFAFFCRRANILKIKSRYSKKEIILKGRGVIFHVTPSNVPVNFAYSLLCGILTGNVNIVRVPSKEFEQLNIIIKAIQTLSPNHPECCSRIILCRYDRSNQATDHFSAMCDVRIIWGGDDTIRQIRKSTIPVRAFDICFADRYSMCAINASVYLNENKKKEIANAFYNDTYLFDQNACTAPHLIIWIGNSIEVDKAKTIFWNFLHTIVEEKYNLQALSAVDKLYTLFHHATHHDRVNLRTTKDNLLWRIEIDTLQPDIELYRCSCGYFIEYQGLSLYDLNKIVNPKYQTLSYFGFNKTELENFASNTELTGIDRIVPIGRTTDFSVIWDGYDLINTLTRTCDLM